MLDDSADRFGLGAYPASFSGREHFGINSFFRLHASIMERRKHEQYLSEAAFRGFFQELRAASLCRLFEARAPGGRLIASQLVLLGPNPVCHVAQRRPTKIFSAAGFRLFSAGSRLRRCPRSATWRWISQTPR